MTAADSEQRGQDGRTIDRLRARVAELEAEVAALKAVPVHRARGAR